MILTVRPAQTHEAAFAWPMYRDYIAKHIFPKAALSASSHTWLSDEETKFTKSWDHEMPHIIEVDDVPIGWLSLAKTNNRLTVHNVFVEDAWQAKGISERIFSEMIPVWKSEKRFVEVPVLMADPLSAAIERTLTRLGFSAGSDDGLVRHLVADFSK